MLKKVLVSLLLSSSLSVSFAEITSSQDFISTSTQSILNKISVAKTEQYRPIVREEALPLFDWEQISRGTLGKNWRQMSEVQRKEFTQSFQALLIKTYGTYIEPYKKADFSVLGVKKLESGDSVKVKLKALGQQDIVLDYRVSSASSKYLIQDVIIDGISFVQVFKTGFNDEISKTSIDEFLKKLAAKTQ